MRPQSPKTEPLGERRIGSLRPRHRSQQAMKLIGGRGAAPRLYLRSPPPIAPAGSTVAGNPTPCRLAGAGGDPAGAQMAGSNPAQRRSRRRGEQLLASPSARSIAICRAERLIIRLTKGVGQSDLLAALARQRRRWRSAPSTRAMPGALLIGIPNRFGRHLRAED